MSVFAGTEPHSGMQIDEMVAARVGAINGILKEESALKNKESSMRIDQHSIKEMAKRYHQEDTLGVLQQLFKCIQRDTLFVQASLEECNGQLNRLVPPFDKLRCSYSRFNWGSAGSFWGMFSSTRDPWTSTEVEQIAPFLMGLLRVVQEEASNKESIPHAMVQAVHTRLIGVVSDELLAKIERVVRALKYALECAHEICRDMPAAHESMSAAWMCMCLQVLVGLQKQKTGEDVLVEIKDTFDVIQKFEQEIFERNFVKSIQNITSVFQYMVFADYIRL